MIPCVIEVLSNNYRNKILQILNSDQGLRSGDDESIECDATYLICFNVEIQYEVNAVFDWTNTTVPRIVFGVSECIAHIISEAMMHELLPPPIPAFEGCFQILRILKVDLPFPRKFFFKFQQELQGLFDGCKGGFGGHLCHLFFFILSNPVFESNFTVFSNLPLLMDAQSLTAQP